jgi:hypothetical protein
MRMIYMAVRGVVLGGTSGPRAVLQHGTYQETNRRTDEVSVLYFVQTEVGLGGFFSHATGPRPRLIEELCLDEPLSGMGQQDCQTRLRLSAEAHRRLAEPLYAIATAPIAAGSLVTSGLPHLRDLQGEPSAGAVLYLAHNDPALTGPWTSHLRDSDDGDRALSVGTRRSLGRAAEEGHMNT